MKLDGCFEFMLDEPKKEEFFLDNNGTKKTLISVIKKKIYIYYPSTIKNKATREEIIQQNYLRLLSNLSDKGFQ